MLLQDLLNIELPIIQAPMAGAQDHRLAVAVSNAGGLGSLPAAMLSADVLNAELEVIQRQTSKPYNVNFFCHSTPIQNAEKMAAWRQSFSKYYREFGLREEESSIGPARRPFDERAAKVIEEAQPPVVSFHFGLPSASLLNRVKRNGAKIMSTATTVEEGRSLQARGVDVVIAQGLEAGGHRGNFLSADLSLHMNTMTLVRELVAALDVPVIAAGGISNSKSINQAMSLGAAGVQIGTAYLLCHESKVSAVHRAALKNKNFRDTAITNIFSGRPARGIINRLIKERGPIATEAPEFPLAANAISPLRAAAEKKLSGDFSPLWSGINNSDCEEISAAEMTRKLCLDN